MHKYRFTFLTGLAAGYVLGARAGRERYEQIVRLGRQVADNPAAQQAAGAVQAQAAGLAKTARQKVSDGLHDRMPNMSGSKIAGYVPGMRHGNGNGGTSDTRGSTQGSGDRSYSRE
ncbi:MAG TPA: YtxH domain-containing protein [Streptosporangiaceae bacterium]|jgi:hypothetical protein|nr:YtxH domain-containing protein [Streptosporangiaceae bacterium]